MFCSLVGITLDEQALRTVITHLLETSADEQVTGQKISINER